MFHHVSTLIFDLDGTISDPSLGAYHSFNHALAAYGLPAISRAVADAAIGPTLDETFVQLCPHADTAMITGLIVAYREYYADKGYAENEVYPGIPAALETFSARGVRMGICTTKRADFAKKILALFGLLPHFQFLSGGDIGIHKRQQLAALLEAGDIDTAAVMVGDRDIDIYAAKTNGLRSAGVLWGFGSIEELTTAGPDALVGTVSDLRDLVATGAVQQRQGAS